VRRCVSCRRRIWPWQSWSGWGPAGFQARNADLAQHTACMRRQALERHQGEHQRTGLCSLLDCPNDTAQEAS
jgi:hypothetical protein